MTLFERALIMAVALHAGQKTRAGDPYILHVLGVWHNVRTTGHDEKVQIVALLHDVVENTDTSVDHIRRAFGADIGAAVDAMSRRPGEPYDTYLKRVKADAIAPAVKLADTRENYTHLDRVEDVGTRKRLAAQYDKVIRAFG